MDDSRPSSRGWTERPECNGCVKNAKRMLVQSFYLYDDTSADDLMNLIADKYWLYSKCDELTFQKYLIRKIEDMKWCGVYQNKAKVRLEAKCGKIINMINEKMKDPSMENGLKKRFTKLLTSASKVYNFLTHRIDFRKTDKRTILKELHPLLLKMNGMSRGGTSSESARAPPGTSCGVAAAEVKQEGDSSTAANIGTSAAAQNNKDGVGKGEGRKERPPKLKKKKRVKVRDALIADGEIPGLFRFKRARCEAKAPLPTEGNTRLEPHPCPDWVRGILREKWNMSPIT